MTKTGALSAAPHARIRRMTILLVGWHVVVLALGLWWSSLLIKQGRRIHELEMAQGLTPILSEERLERMLFWESNTFLFLLVGSSAGLGWMYWRDLKRARQVQAFFAAFTHELKTPLTSIRLQAESLADARDKKETDALVGRMLEDTQRLESQVEKTLELARVEGGGQLFSENVRIKPWLERKAREWKTSYGDRLELAFESIDAVIEADPGALAMIFRNLVENAFRHSGQDHVKIKIDVARDSGKIAVTVANSGKGYAGNDRELGEIFTKGKGSQGAGVGLYLVRTLMERMQGEAEFESINGFTVHLRFAEAASNG